MPPTFAPLRRSATTQRRPAAQFRWIWIASVATIAGDQLGRVALSVLIFRATHSAAATAAAYALTFLPGLAGAFLGHLADRWPRRDLMVACELAGAGLFAVMAVPATPSWLVCVLFAAAVVVAGPFTAAAAAVLADLFTGPEYRRVVGTRQAGGQAAQVAGFAVGGAVVAAAGPRGALLVDAATFAVAAVIIAVGVQRRPPLHPAGSKRPPAPQQAVRVLRGAGQRRRLGYFALVGFWIVPEGLAAPYAADHAAGSIALGVLLAAMPTGYIAASLVLSRLPAARGHQLVGPLAVAAGVPLMLCLAGPPVPVAVALWAATGAFSGYVAIVIAEYLAGADPTLRGQAAGLSSAAGLVAQGIGAGLGGLVAQGWTTGGAIAIAGATGTLSALALTVTERGTHRYARRRSLPPPGSTPDSQEPQP